MNGVVTEFAPAKLNLALSVGPPGDDGMHPICSWMVAVDLVDELEVRSLQPGSLSRYAIYWHENARRRTDIDWPIRTDLAVRAHLALQKHTSRELPVQLKLAKCIPAGGGLGGGSSDAAAMLRAVNRLYELGLTSADLASIGSSIGSDVSFFVAGGSALVHGTGQHIEPDSRSPELHAVVVFPEGRCDTARVYRRFDERSRHAAALRTAEIESLRASAPTQNLSELLFNDLTDAAIDTAPELRELLRDLTRVAERLAHVTGSGSSMFIICDDPLHAQALAAAIEQRLNLPVVAVRKYEPAHETTVH